MFVKLSRSRLTAYPCKSLPACLTQSSKSSRRRRYPAANHLKPSSLLLLIKPMARRINLRSQIRQLRKPRSATCRRYSTSPPSLATSTACRNTRRLAIIWPWFIVNDDYANVVGALVEMFSLQLINLCIGQHIESSPLSAYYLTFKFDVHGGGLIDSSTSWKWDFPVLCCRESSVSDWILNMHISNNNDKTSKSLGSFFVVRWERWSPSICLVCSFEGAAVSC